MICRYAGTDRPRILADRHTDDCRSETCPGCQPCDRPHCRVCGITHTVEACEGCLTDTRDALKAIPIRYAELTSEVVVKGVQSEAAMLHGPAANPEAWLQRGRYGHVYVADARLGENHPAWVLGSWQYRYRAEFGHEMPTEFTIPDAADYLDRNLAYLSGYPDLPFDDFARDVRACNAHIEAVLRDQAFGDRANVNCFKCGGPLERKLTQARGFEDVWTCQRCRRTYTPSEYNIALRAKLETPAVPAP